MGLGPPVCQKCIKIMTLIEKAPYWKCKICGEIKTEKHAWEYTKEEQRRHFGFAFKDKNKESKE